jgi:putative redox protein
MAKLHAVAKMVQGPLIVLENGRAHATVVDRPSASSLGVGPTPLELCIMSHAGCYVTIAQFVAVKMRLQLKGLEVTVEALKSEEAGTIVEETFDILYKTDAAEDQVKRLHEHTLKNCPVGVLFKKAGVKTSYNIKTQKE